MTQAREKTEMAEYVLELAKGYLERLRWPRPMRMSASA